MQYLCMNTIQIYHLLVMLCHRDITLDDVEAELAGDILNIEFADDSKFVINSHRAARQIWMAAGTTAWHFDYDGERWVSSKTREELWSVVEQALSSKLGRKFTLQR